MTHVRSHKRNKAAMKAFAIFFTSFLLIIFCAPEARGNALSVDLELRTHVRTDRLHWHIAGGNVNILSELITEDIDILQVGLRAKLTKNNYVFFAEGAYGTIRSGKTTDRDYRGDDRTGLYSESVSDISGRNARDLSAGAGRHFHFNSNRYRLTPLIGASHHRLRLLKTDGMQTVATPGETPPVGPIPGLASTYDATWNALWAGGKFMVRASESIELRAAYRYHWFDYRADAGWNLRQDLAQPVSFTHRASGSGFDVDISCRYALSAQAGISFSFLHRERKAENGTDTTYLATGQQFDIPLNKVSWRSQSVLAGIEYRF